MKLDSKANRDFVLFVHETAQEVNNWPSWMKGNMPSPAVFQGPYLFGTVSQNSHNFRIYEVGKYKYALLCWCILCRDVFGVDDDGYLLEKASLRAVFSKIDSILD